MSVFSLRGLAAGALPAAACLCSSLSNAQTLVGNVAPEVVVSATRIEQPLADALLSVSVFTRADIERSQASSLGDLLRGESGFEFARNGGPGTTTSFFLRGANSTNLVVLIDGVRTQADAFGSLTAIDIPLALIERVELLRGNASALYGEAAIGGVIQIFTRGAKAGAASGASISAGSRRARGGDAFVSGSQGETAYRLAVGTQADDGFSAIDTSQLPTANPDRDGYRKRYVAGSLEQALQAGWRLSVSVRGERDDLAYDDYYLASPTDVHRLQRAQQAGSVGLRGNLTPDWKTTVSVSTSGIRSEDTLNGGPNFGPSGDYAPLINGRTTSLRWENTSVLGERATSIWGADLSREVYRGNSVPVPLDARRSLAGYFAGATVEASSALSLQVNARHDVVQMNDEAAGPLNSARVSADSWLLGGGYKINAEWRFTAAVSTGFRAPSAGELFSQGFGNPGLKPEAHRGHEAGLEFSAAGTRLRAIAFQAKTTSAIDFDPLSGVLVNAGQVRNEGMELNASTQFAGRKILVGWTIQDPRNAATGESLARRARSFGSIEMLQPFEGGEFGIKMIATSSRRDVDGSFAPVTLAPYWLTDLSYSRRLSGNWRLRVNLHNAFDQRYQLAYGYNTPGRSLMAQLDYQSP